MANKQEVSSESADVVREECAIEYVTVTKSWFDGNDERLVELENMLRDIARYGIRQNHEYGKAYITDFMLESIADVLNRASPPRTAVAVSRHIDVRLVRPDSSGDPGKAG
jgi:predicted HD phosphohydrolase